MADDPDNQPEPAEPSAQQRSDWWSQVVPALVSGAFTAAVALAGFFLIGREQVKALGANADFVTLQTEILEETQALKADLDRLAAEGAALQNANLEAEALMALAPRFTTESYHERQGDRWSIALQVTNNGEFPIDCELGQESTDNEDYQVQLRRTEDDVVPGETKHILYYGVGSLLDENERVRFSVEITCRTSEAIAKPLKDIASGYSQEVIDEVMARQYRHDHFIWAGANERSLLFFWR